MLHIICIMRSIINSLRYVKYKAFEYAKTYLQKLCSQSLYAYILYINFYEPSGPDTYYNISYIDTAKHFIRLNGNPEIFINRKELLDISWFFMA